MANLWPIFYTLLLEDPWGNPFGKWSTDDGFSTSMLVYRRIIYIHIYNVYIYIQYTIYIYTIYIYTCVCVTTYPFVDIYSTIRTDEGSEAAYCLCTMYSVFTPICSKRSKYRLIHQTDQSPTVDFAFYTYPLALWQSNIACWSLHLVRRFPSYKHPFSSRISQLATFDYWRVIFITLWLWLTVCHGKIHHF
jgi:hypothetical protein